MEIRSSHCLKHMHTQEKDMPKIRQQRVGAAKVPAEVAFLG